MPVALAELKQLASTLNPYHPIVEPVRALFMEKGDDGWRIVTAFGPQREALQKLCADILRIRLPAYHFDFMEKGNGGAEGAALRLKARMEGVECHSVGNTDQGAVCLGVPIEGGQHDYVVTADIKDCFRSLNKERVAKQLPLPELAVRNVLLIQDDVHVIVEPPTWARAGIALLPPSAVALFNIEADTAARRGIPQGSSASNLIMSRAVLGPLLHAAPFANRVCLYGDDIAVTAKSWAEAEADYKTQRSRVENSPAGPLAIGRHKIQHSSELINFVKYGLKRTLWDGKVDYRLRPSSTSFRRSENKLMRICLDGPTETMEEQVQVYRAAWIKAFPLWKPTQASLDILEVATLEVMSEAARLRKEKVFG